MAPRLHPFEFIGAYKLYTEERFLLADEMGMFKTAQSIFANNKFREKKRGRLRTLVVCPTSVRDHWVEEIQKWGYPRNPQINVVNTNTIRRDITRIKSADWNIIHYPLISAMDEEPLERLVLTGFHHVILDEIHNAKNPFAIRTTVVKTLADQADFLSLLSGTPIPNTLVDLYTLMSLLDPQKYPLDPTNIQIARQSFLQLYLDQPQAVKELLHRKMLHRKAQDYVGDKIPILNEHRVPIELTGAHLAAYRHILEENMSVGKKIMLLAQASVDPCLVNDSLPRRKQGKDSSVKFEFLDEIVAKEMKKRSGKVLIFSNLKKGVISELRDRYEQYGVVEITGETSTEGSIREDLRLRFQTDTRTRILLATTTMNEGVDLTAATAIVNLTVPWTPAEYYQRLKRSQRPGEIRKDSVDAYLLYATIPGAQSSLEQASVEMLDGKQQIVQYLMSGIQLSMEELREFDNPARVPRIASAIQSPGRAIIKYYFKWRGIGSERASRWMENSPEMAKYIAELYPSFSMARNAADIYVPRIRELEKRRKLTPKVDLACGPGMLGHFLREPTFGIDINREMLRVGRKMNQENRLAKGSIASVPLTSGIAGLVVCSLAYQMTKPQDERARTLYEMSRILKTKGYAIIILPPNYLAASDYEKFENASAHYGFRIIEHDTNQGPSKLEMYILQKERAPDKKIFKLNFKGDPGRKCA